jgi:uncharacterized damage-inducible protein DinB
MASSNGVVLDAFRHNAWASKQLIAFCRQLSSAQLTAPGVASYGSIIETFNHYVGSDAGYLGGLTGARPDWPRGELVGLDELERRVDETHARWADFLAEPFDAERVLILDDGEYEARAGIEVAQALHHANVHREQICAIITGFGLQPPELDVWDYADAVGRGRLRAGATDDLTTL